MWYQSSSPQCGINQPSQNRYLAYQNKSKMKIKEATREKEKPIVPLYKAISCQIYTYASGLFLHKEINATKKLATKHHSIK
jgi:hypothetical protein